jgi:hypothetical protein
MKQFAGKVPVIVITQTQHFHSYEAAFRPYKILQLAPTRGQSDSMPLANPLFSLSYPVLNYLTTIK